MRNNFAGKVGAIIAILLLFTYGIFFGRTTPKLGSVKEMLSRSIHLGLDLKGGTHLVLQVHVAEALGAQTDNDVVRLQSDLQKAGIAGAQVSKLDPTQPTVITVSGVPSASQNMARPTIDTNYAQSYDIASNANGYTLTMKPEVVKSTETRALDTSIETIRSRVDSLGVAEPVIQKYGLGDNQILVELPGVDNAEQVRDIIQSTARLEVHEVVGGPYQTEAEAAQATGGVIAPDVVVLPSIDPTGKTFYSVKRISVVQGPDFRDAQPSTDEGGRPDITFNLTTEAGDRFYRYTDENKGTGRMAIVLDNIIREVAGIQSAIRDSGRISGGGFTKQSAADLSLMLRTGSLPASISFLDTLTVGASLGASSIQHGVFAALAGMFAVMLFMLIYYKGAGINADLALILNLVILLGFMGFTGSTLTLPGIAGVILTIGMGVDSNVLIFERIREELHLGRTPGAAVKNGFDHAWVTIVDTHVTTIVSAAILFLFGTGPIRGFAVTLTFGLLANIFTAVFVSRTIFDAILARKTRGEALSI